MKYSKETLRIYRLHAAKFLQWLDGRQKKPLDDLIEDFIAAKGATFFTARQIRTALNYKSAVPMTVRVTKTKKLTDDKRIAVLKNLVVRRQFEPR